MELDVFFIDDSTEKKPSRSVARQQIDLALLKII